jgi:hypothetical protein
MAGDRRALWLLTEALALNSMWSQVPWLYAHWCLCGQGYVIEFLKFCLPF